MGGIAKGSGMIHPNMATMLSVITTDANVAPDVWRGIMQRGAANSFNQVCHQLHSSRWLEHKLDQYFKSRSWALLKRDCFGDMMSISKTSTCYNKNKQVWTCKFFAIVKCCDVRNVLVVWWGLLVQELRCICWSISSTDRSYALSMCHDLDVSQMTSKKIRQSLSVRLPQHTTILLAKKAHYMSWWAPSCRSIPNHSLLLSDSSWHPLAEFAYTFDIADLCGWWNEHEWHCSWFS